MEERLRILLCEDDENLGMLLREYLQAKGFNADLYPDAQERWFFNGAGDSHRKFGGANHIPYCQIIERGYPRRLQDWS